MYSVPLLVALAAAAIPTCPAIPRVTLDAATTLSPAQLAALAPYTQFARAAYCSPSIVQYWTCGRMSLSWLSMTLPSDPSQRLAKPSPDSRFLSQVGTVTPSNTVSPSPPYIAYLFSSLSRLCWILALLQLHSRRPPGHRPHTAVALAFPCCCPFVHSLLASPISPMPTSSCKASTLPSFLA